MKRVLPNPQEINKCVRVLSLVAVNVTLFGYSLGICNHVKIKSVEWP